MTVPVPILTVRDLVVEYGGGSRRSRAVDGVSFTIHRGECVGFIGVNGAGKSSTLKSILGFLLPRSGQIEVFGSPAGSTHSRQRIGYLPEVAQYYPFLKGRELLEIYGRLSGVPDNVLHERIPALLRRAGLEGRGESLLQSYSKGMQQRLGIAQSLLADPELLIYDELSSGLDPLGRHDLRGLLAELKASGCTILFSSHELTEVEGLCDRVILIHRGRILEESGLPELKERLGGASLEDHFVSLVREAP